MHTYARLKYDDPSKVVKNEKGYITCSGLTEVKMERVLTAGELKVENRQLGEMGRHVRYKVGDTTEGFITEQDAINAAIKYFNENFDTENSVLYKGDYASCSAWQTLLVWPKKHDAIAKSMINLAAEFQALNGYESKVKSEAYMTRLDARWRKRYNKMNELCSPESTVKK